MLRLCSGRRCVDGPEQHSWHVAGSGGDVALCAIQLGSFERWVIGFLLIEDIKNRALHRVERNEFQDFPLMHLADINVVVVVEGAWRLRRDLLVLETGF